jgi:exopolyphosphatase / guanosine-5'-triphosphate,3'-diphosphate pyrophosphatase
VDAAQQGPAPETGRVTDTSDVPQASGATEPDNYAALDLGTNNCRLLIATPRKSGFAVVDAFSRIVRLGEGLGANGRLNDMAMDRTVHALRICANKLLWHSVKKRRLIATEACRTAENGPIFIQRVADETGLELEIINRETEARLAAVGASPLIDPTAESTVVFDIGGGSTEVLWLDRQGERHAIKAWTSLQAGVVSLSEKVGGGAIVTPDIFAEMRIFVRQLLSPFASQIAELNGHRYGPSHLLGTSGTVTTIAGVHLGLRHYDRSKVDGCWMSAGAVTDVTARLLAMTYQQRIDNGCIGRERADLVLAGCAILEEVRAAFPAERVRVADRGLREGILAELLQRDGFGRGIA